MKNNELLSYVFDFISQISDNKEIISTIRKIILFGSLARGDMHENSDIDLFIDTTNQELNNLIKKELNKFESRAEKTWHLRNIKTSIKIIADDIEKEKWADLKEEIQGYGKVLYGKIDSSPNKLNQKVLITYNLTNISQKDKMSLIRKLYGYSLKKQNKIYTQKGLLEELNGEKISPNAFIISVENLQKVKKELNEHKVKYLTRPIWVK